MRQLKLTKRNNLVMRSNLNEIGKLEVQAANKEITLSGRNREGNDDSFVKMVKANQRLVKLVATKYQNQGLSLAHLISEGNLGLINAAERFDKTNEYAFIPFAMWWIHQSILQSIKENSIIVSLPLNKIGSNNKIRKIFIKLEKEYQREPSLDEMNEIMAFFPEIV